MNEERSEVTSYSVSFICPNYEKRVSRSSPFPTIEETIGYGKRLAYVIEDCACGETHVIEICAA